MRLRMRQKRRTLQELTSDPREDTGSMDMLSSSWGSIKGEQGSQEGAERESLQRGNHQLLERKTGVDGLCFQHVGAAQGEQGPGGCGRPDMI
eukprot:gene18843-25391_t